jgi:hypothetical protein
VFSATPEALVRALIMNPVEVIVPVAGVVGVPETVKVKVLAVGVVATVLIPLYSG